MGNKIHVNGPGHITKTAATPINVKKNHQKPFRAIHQITFPQNQSDDLETWHGTFGMQTLKKYI